MASKQAHSNTARVKKRHRVDPGRILADYFTKERRQSRELGLAIIGGTGLEDFFASRKDARVFKVKTPFDEKRQGPVTILQANILGMECAFLPRHGLEHNVPPTEINYRANIYALAIELGAINVLSIVAAGATDKERYSVGDLVLVRDLIKLTPGPTFFTTYFESFNGKHIHAHMTEPYSPGLIIKIENAAGNAGIPLNKEERPVLMETPGNRFQTRAEVQAFRMLGANLLNMTSASETILLNELRKVGWDGRNATLAVVTDYAAGLIGPKEFKKVEVAVKAREADITQIINRLIPLMKSDDRISP